MKRLLGGTHYPGRTEYHYLHYGSDGREKITVETVQEVDPVFDHVKDMSDTRNRKSSFRYRATVPFTLIEDLCKTHSVLWGIKPIDAFREIMNGSTDRGKAVQKILLNDIDYSKLQAR